MYRKPQVPRQSCIKLKLWPKVCTGNLGVNWFFHKSQKWEGLISHWFLFFRCAIPASCNSNSPKTSAPSLHLWTYASLSHSPSRAVPGPCFSGRLGKTKSKNNSSNYPKTKHKHRIFRVTLKRNQSWNHKFSAKKPLQHIFLTFSLWEPVRFHTVIPASQYIA